MVLFGCTLDLESGRKRRKKSVGKVLKIMHGRPSSSSSSGSGELSLASSERSKSVWKAAVQDAGLSEEKRLTKWV